MNQVLKGLFVLAVFFLISDRLSAQPSEVGLLDETIEVKATVKKVDLQNRVVTLKLEKGGTQEFHAGPEVINLPRIKVGDRVTMKYRESLSYVVLKPGQSSGQVLGKETKIARAAPGERLAGEITHSETIVTTVVSLDFITGLLTLKMPDNSVRVFTVRDVSRLQGVAPGDQIEIKASRILAAAVTKPAS
jgi:Cu/Ag efflux protein CusF